MAKSKSVSVNSAILAGIMTAMHSTPEQHGWINQADGEPLMGHQPPLIDVNFGITDGDKYAVVLTQAGKELLMNTSPNGSNGSAEAAKPSYDIITNAVMPASKRGAKGGGAPTKYPFDKMEIGQSFFVAKSAEHPNPVKTLGSTVSSANMRFSLDTGQTKTVTRVKRGVKNRALLDAQGMKVMETVQVPIYKRQRQFAIRPIEKGKTYGDWVAPEDGAMIYRVPVTEKAEA